MHEAENKPLWYAGLPKKASYIKWEEWEDMCNKSINMVHIMTYLNSSKYRLIKSSQVSQAALLCNIRSPLLTAHA